MRPLLAVLLSIAILGAVQGYMVFQRSTAERQSGVTMPTQQAIQGEHRVRATLNFDAAPEAFQLYPAALVVYRMGAETPIAEYPGRIRSGETVEFAAREAALTKGSNRLTVEAWLLSADRSLEIDSTTPDEKSLSDTKDEPTAADPSGGGLTYTIQLQWLDAKSKVIAERSLELLGDSVVVRGQWDLELP